MQIKRRYLEFLEASGGNGGQWDLGDAVGKLYSDGDDGKPAQLLSTRLIVPEHHLRDFAPDLLEQLLASPSEHLPAFEDALKEVLRSGRHDPGLLKLLGDHTDIRIGLKGDFGRHEVSPRELTSALLGKLVAVFGIVTKCSVVRPKVRAVEGLVLGTPFELVPICQCKHVSSLFSLAHPHPLPACLHTPAHMLC